MAQINTFIANITSTIQDGFSLMRELLLRPQFVHLHSSSGQFLWYPPSYIHTTPLHQPFCTHLHPISLHTNLDDTHLHRHAAQKMKPTFHSEEHCCKTTSSDCTVLNFAALLYFVTFIVSLYIVHVCVCVCVSPDRAVICYICTRTFIC